MCDFWNLKCLQLLQKVRHGWRQPEGNPTANVDKAEASWKIITTDKCGRCIVATRDILPGEAILMEQALTITPNMERESPMYPTCLGCCRSTNTSYRCSKCHWPVCNKKCEKIPVHRAFECKVFQKFKNRRGFYNCYSPSPTTYNYIGILRSLLLEKLNPAKFAKLLSLESHTEERYVTRRNRNGSIEKTMSPFVHSVTNFLEALNQPQSIELVNQVVGVHKVNSFGQNRFDEPELVKQSCSLLFDQLSLLNHSCCPNARLATMVKDSTGLYHWGQLRATRFITKGEPITLSYVDSSLGTYQRQRSFRNIWFFRCDCLRCKDPTEMGSFMSAVKCQDCHEGMLLPIDPLDPESKWECNNCRQTEDVSDINAVLTKLQNMIFNCDLRREQLDVILNEHSGHTVHVNHYLIITVKYDLLDSFADSVRAKGCPNDLSLVERMLEYSNQLQTIVDVICPGKTTDRVTIMYFKCLALFCRMKLNKDPEVKRMCRQEVYELVGKCNGICEGEIEGTRAKDMEIHLAWLIAEVERMEL